MSEPLKHLKKENYIAGMVLSSVGDALGYKNGEWEFCSDGSFIHQMLKETFGGLNQLDIKLPNWRVSDDTVMHLATAEALISYGHANKGAEDVKLYQKIAEKYKECMQNMVGRMPGITCMNMCERLNPENPPEGLRIPFSTSGGGCGAAMRSMCIGLRYPHPSDINDLIAVSIESGRLTHHHPTGYLGSLASALFTSYAVQKKPLFEWGEGLLSTLDESKKYIQKSKLYSEGVIKENIKYWDYFELKWKSYLNQEKIHKVDQGNVNERDSFNEMDEVKKRDEFYKTLSYDGMGGASGHDAPMIAYDALQACNGSWEELCNRAMFHGGDSDSTGVIAGCLYGVLYGREQVQPCNYINVEFYEKSVKAAESLFMLAIQRNGKESDVDGGPDYQTKSDEIIKGEKTDQKQGSCQRRKRTHTSTEDEVNSKRQEKTKSVCEKLSSFLLPTVLMIFLLVVLAYLRIVSSVVTYF